MMKKRFVTVIAALISAFCALFIFGCSKKGKGVSGGPDVPPDVPTVTEYSVVFHANGGEFDGGAATYTEKVESGKYAAGKTPVRAEYDFSGWCSDDKCTVSVTLATEPITSDRDFYAKWTAKTPPTDDDITVTYYYNYDNAPSGGVYKSQTVDRGGSAVAPTAPSRSGYKFKGWYEDENGKTPFDHTSSLNSSKNLYAAWELIVVLNGITVTPPAVVTYFAGDEIDYTGLVVTAKYNTGDVTLKSGEYTISPVDMTTPGPKTVTVSFEGKSADFRITVELPRATALVIGGSLTYAEQETGAPFDPAGLTFTVKYNDGSEKTVKAADVEFVSDSIVNGRLAVAGSAVITASYDGVSSEIRLTVVEPAVVKHDFEFDANLSAAQTALGIEPSGVPGLKRVEHGTACAEPAAPTFKGFAFGGWYTSAACTDAWDFDTAIETDVKVYAKWTEINYTVEYVGAAGMTTDNVTAYKITDGTVALKNPTALPEGYYFLGWAAEQGSTDHITELTDAMIAHADAQNKIKIYAAVDNKYDVTFDGNKPDGVAAEVTGLPSAAKIAYGSKLTEPKAPALSGYNFLGWYKDAAHKTAWSFADDTVKGATTLYARWVKQADDGRYILGTFNGWDQAFEEPDVGAYKMQVVTAGKEWKISGVTLAKDDEFRFADYVKVGGAISWQDPVSADASVRPSVMTLEVSGNNYKVKTYDIEGGTWTIECGTNAKDEAYISFTLDGYIDFRNPATGEVDKVNVTEQKTETADVYIKGTFNGNFKATEAWSNSSKLIQVTEKDGVYTFGKVYLKRYDAFKVYVKSGEKWFGGTFKAVGSAIALSSNNAPDIYLGTIEDGYYNLVFDNSGASKTLTIYKWSDVSIDFVTEKPIYVGHVPAKENIIVTCDGKAVTDYDLSGSTAAVSGENASTVTVVYDHYVYTARYTAVEVAPVSIEVTALPNVTAYYAGGEIDRTGMVVTVTFNDGHTETTTDYTLSALPTVGNTEDAEAKIVCAITVTYSETFTDKFDVDVYNKLSALEITAAPTKTKYFTGEALDLTGMEVAAYYNGGKTLNKTVTAAITSEPANGAVLGIDDGTVTVSYTFAPTGLRGVTLTAAQTLEISVPRVTGITVSGTPAKTAYTVGDAFDPTGLTVSAAKEFGDPEAVALENVTFTSASINAENKVIAAAGDAVTVTLNATYKTDYAEFKTTATVTLKVQNLLTSIEVTTVPTAPHTAGFVEGDGLTTDGMVVTAHYNEGISGAESASEAVSGYTVTPVLGTALTKGEHEITVEYGGKSTSFTVSVIAKAVVDFAVKEGSVVPRQSVGAALSTTGMTFVATYNNDDVIEITETDAEYADITFDVKSNYDSGTKTFATPTGSEGAKVEAAFGGCSLEFTVEVVNTAARTVTFVTDNKNYEVTNRQAPVSVEFESTLDSSVVKSPVCKGFTFDGWYTDENRTAAYDFTAKVTSAFTLYAKWTANSYTVITYVDGKAWGSALTFEAVNGEFAELTIAEPSKEHYTFVGWTRNSDLTADTVKAFGYADLDAADGDTIKLYAAFEIDKYDVTFKVDGEVYSTAEAEYNGLVVAPTAPVKKGYTFDAWLANGTPWNFDEDKVTGALELSAKFTAKKYTVAYVTDGGSDGGNPAEYTAGNTVTLSDAQKSGFAFGGWFTDAGFAPETKVTSIDDSLIPSDDGAAITLYAKFTEVTYCTVEFNYNYTDAPNGGVYETVGNIEVGNTVSTVTAPERTGHDFGGWYKEAACLNAWNFGEDTVKADITLYAKWDVKKFDVTFDSDVPKQTVEYGKTAVEPDAPAARAGYRFDGWFEKDAKDPFDFTAPITAAKALGAKWTVVNGFYSGTTLFKEFVVKGDTEYAAECMLVTTANTSLVIYRDGKAQTTQKKASSPAAANFSVSGTTVMFTASGVYSVYYDYGTSDPGLYVVRNGNVSDYVAPDIKDGDGIYVGGKLVAPFVFNSNNMNQVMAQGVVVTAAKETATVTVTLKYKGSAAVLSHIEHDAAVDVVKGDTADSFKLYAGTYNFYYNYAKNGTDAEGKYDHAANRLWIDGTQIGGPAISLDKDAYVAGTFNGWTANLNSYKFGSNGTITLDLPKDAQFKIVYDGNWLGFDSVSSGTEYVESASNTDKNILVKTSGKYKLVFDGSKLRIARIGEYEPVIALGENSAIFKFKDGTVVIKLGAMPVPSGSDWQGLDSNSAFAYDGNLTSWSGRYLLNGDTYTIDKNMSEVSFMVGFTQSGNGKNTAPISGSKFTVGKVNVVNSVNNYGSWTGDNWNYTLSTEAIKYL